MSIVLGGRDAWRVFRRKSFIVGLQHVGIAGEDPEPSLVIWPARPAPGAGAMVIGLSSIGQYLDSRSGMPTPYALHAFTQALQTMHINPMDRFSLRELADIVYEYAEDLIRMPPKIERQRLPRGVDAIEAFVDGESVGVVH